MPLTTAVAGGAALLGNVISGYVGAKQQSKAIDKQIAAQKAENAATREHNLQLAHLQNSMNIEQWKRENKYNSPAAQMARFQAAGLNPNLIYGESNTSGQISGSLTSGAPATPTDMSALGNKRSGLASAFKAAGDAAMQIPMYREQVESLKLANDEKRLDIAAKQHEKDIRDWLGGLFTFGSDEPISPSDYSKLNDTMINQNQLRALNELRMQSEQIKEKEGANRLFDKNFDSIVREVTANSDLKRAEAAYLLRTLQGRVDATNEDNKIKTVEDFEGWFQLLVRFSRVIADSVGRVIK